MPAQVLLFSLEELRRRHGDAATPGADPRDDTAPFRAFRGALLAAAARLAAGEAALSMWWEGTFNGYHLAVQADPAEALPDLPRAAAAACPVEAVRLAPPRTDGYPLARVRPGSAEPERGAGGELFEAPFGAGGGHFGAPGMRRRG
ncbi:MAG TPA: hypothetical protein VH880_02375 [Anaeromyxobacteraceae bacterium]